MIVGTELLKEKSILNENSEEKDTNKNTWGTFVLYKTKLIN
jgi:hypothetical protein